MSAATASKHSNVVRCLINGRFLTAPATGVQRVARQIATALAEASARGDAAMADIRFELAVPKGAGGRAAEIGLPVREFGPLSGNLWEQLTLPRQTGDAVLLNLCNMGPLVATRSVTMIHDAQVFQSPLSYSRAFRTWYRFAHRRIGRRHAAILTVSRFSADELARLGVTDRAQIVHNGSDHVFARPADPSILARLPLAPGERYVLGLASTLAHKNIALLMRAFADPRLRDIRLLLYGAADRAAFAAAGIAMPEGVIFAGRVDDAALRALIEHALCLAFPSSTEGFGLPPLEAMQLGCPVITTPAGALPEVCGDAALYAGCDDPDAWVTAITRLAGDVALRARMAEAGRRHAAPFSWTAAAQRVAAIVRAVGTA